MTKIAYFQCPTGIAGDMCLGALVDAGVPLDYLRDNLAKLGLGDEYTLRLESVLRRSQQATKVHVDLAIQPNHHRHRHLPTIEGLIHQSHLPPRATDWSLRTFRQLAIAEGQVHGIPPKNVHFHEVGATDAIVDIVGTCLGLDWLNIDQIYCSALPTGSGTVKAAHGILPVPVPAVVKLWEMRQVPIYSNGIAKELVTPTGAAIVTTLAQTFGDPPAMALIRMGLGAGSQDLEIPNVLRLWIGEAIEPQPIASPFKQEAIALLQTQIDDLNPQIISYLFDILYQAGALDVFTQAIGMKKSRPGILLTVICPSDRQSACEQILFRETTTIGIRHQIQHRSILDRHIQTIKTDFGEIRLKIASYQTAGQTHILNVQPEYEDCARLAALHHQPLHLIHQQAIAHWQDHQAVNPHNPQ
jgi:hypothetical protein